MGLDYLNKKVWHPGSLKNIQKVWQVQQQQLSLKKRYKQKLKKLQQQQHAQQMKRIQVQAGLIPKSHLERMDWMYDWGNKIHQQQKNKQEYLLGNKSANGGKKQAKHDIQQQATNKRCQDFSLLHEDPMFQIQRQEMRMKEQVMSNPFEMKSIIKDVQDNYFNDERDQNQEKLEKKHKSKKHKKQKKDKKHKKKHKHDRSSSSESQQQKNNKKSKSKSKHSKKYSRSRSKSSSSRSSSRQSYDNSSREHASTSTKQSKVYQQYLKQKFNGVLKQDQHGNLKPDYNRFKTKYKTQVQLDQQQRRRRLQQMRQNSKKLSQLKSSKSDPQHSNQKQREYEFEDGLGSLRKDMLNQASHNRNLQKYKEADFQ